jgi:hypothetical protein
MALRMEPSTRKRPVLTTIVTTAALALGSCNALLDNRPADINTDTSATEPTDAAAAPRGAGRDADASVPDPTSGPASSLDPGPGGVEGGTAPPPPPPPCLVGTKPCGGVCVSIDDPSFGCAGPTCQPCAPPHGAGACAAGQCAPGKCAKGWADCNGLASDGCEVDLSATTSCGACGVTCTGSPHADSACVAGACSTECQHGYGDCNHDLADGCEAPLLSSRHNCGECGRTCLVGKCQSGTCVSKP